MVRSKKRVLDEADPNAEAAPSTKKKKDANTRKQVKDASSAESVKDAEVSSLKSSPLHVQD